MLIQEMGRKLDCWVMFCKAKRYRYRGISSLIYELVINQGITLHCLGKSINTLSP